MNYDEAFKNNELYEKELKKFMEKSTEEKCEDLFSSFKALIKNRFNSKRDDRMVLDFVLYRQITQKVRTLRDGGVTEYLTFISSKIDETFRIQMGSDKVNNYMLYAEITRNLPDVESDDDKKLLNEIKKKMKTFENELTQG